jgi:ATP/maltotriose-dependent transcriptional regulator MalT/DNA-binding SARP family transcriptional activator
MTHGPPKLAKLTRPRLHAPVARDRLFRQLDGLRSHSVVWVTGPPGAGKTTLVASYLDAARLGAIWMQLDAADSDPAAFFLYLRQAIGAMEERRARPLPLLTLEYLADLPGFARRFFRDAFARLPPQTLVVLDNYHELAPDSALHEALAAALQEIPPEANVIVASRAEPPSAFAAARLNATIAMLGWSDLKLTAAEAEGVARDRGVADTALATKLHAQTDGWFAGLALLLEQARSGESTRGAVRADALEIVFDFFAQAIFAPASPSMRETLLSVSLLPRISVELLDQISLGPDAVQHLESLFRRHLFVERTSDGERSYRLHALFRAFLRHRADLQLSPERRLEIVTGAARALENAGAWHDAFLLWSEAQAWSAAEAALLSAAARLLAEGRWETVIDCVDAIPPERRSGTPWLRYWWARGKIYEDVTTAIEALDDTYQAFQAAGDIAGQALSAAAVLEARFMYYLEFRSMRLWVDRLVALMPLDALGLPPDDDLRVHSSLLMAATFELPGHPMLPRVRDRVVDLIARSSDANVRITAASILHVHHHILPDRETAAVATRAGRSLLGMPEVTAHNAGFYLMFEAYTHYLQADYPGALQRFEEGDKVFCDAGLVDLADHFALWQAVAQWRGGNPDRAEQCLERIEHSSKTFNASFIPREYVRACIAYARGDRACALEKLELSLASVESFHLPAPLVMLNTGAEIQTRLGALDRAEACLNTARRLATGAAGTQFRAAVALLEALHRHLSGMPDQCREYLAEALALADDPATRLRLRWHVPTLQDLLPVALEAGIEVRRARGLIREFGIVPAHTHVEHWPWALRVHCMGEFGVFVDDEPLTYSRKAPKKTIALLKLLVALGGRDVPEERITDILWPDEEADASKRSLSAALHRLRGLLGHADAIRQSGGALSIERRLCWVDALCIAEYRDEASADRDVIRRYVGPFLEADGGEPWTLPMRERLRSRFIRAVERTGRSLEEAADFQPALALYERGLEADPLIEGFHQGLMRCWLGLGRPAEAGSAYRRLQRTLAVALGSQPTVESQALMERSTRTE